MNKVVLGVLLGGFLGVFDGLTAWFTPAVRPMLLGIVIGSTVKGIIAGAAAGWFARKVRSVPAGVAFGFAVGLVLAYLVAAMPSETGEHYYLEIMLPGSILGAVVGWATQRYGRPPRAAAVAMGMLALLLVVPAYGEPGKATFAGDAFERLKSLEGRWDGRGMTPDGLELSVIYEVTSNGNTVMERMFAGTRHEMITMYTLDEDAVVATHYCTFGNQPTMRLNAAKSDADNLVFDFVSVRGARGDYIKSGSIRFVGDGVEARWTSAQSEPKTLFLRRGK